MINVSKTLRDLGGVAAACLLFFFCGVVTGKLTRLPIPIEVKSLYVTPEFELVIEREVSRNFRAEWTIEVRRFGNGRAIANCSKTSIGTLKKMPLTKLTYTRQEFGAFIQDCKLQNDATYYVAITYTGTGGWYDEMYVESNVFYGPPNDGSIFIPTAT